MGLFDRFKKKIDSEVDKINLEAEMNKAYEKAMTAYGMDPDDFSATDMFGGIKYDEELEDYVEFDLGHQCFRSSNKPSEIFPIEDITGYFILIGTDGGSAVFSFDDVEDPSAVQSIYVDIDTVMFTDQKIMACFYDRFMSSASEEAILSGLSKAREFVEFLEAHGIREREKE